MKNLLSLTNWIYLLQFLVFYSFFIYFNSAHDFILIHLLTQNSHQERKKENERDHQIFRYFSRHRLEATEFKTRYRKEEKL